MRFHRDHIGGYFGYLESDRSKEEGKEVEHLV